MSLPPRSVIVSASACVSYCRCVVQRRVASRINAAFELPVKLTNGSICDCPRLVQERCRWVDFGQCRVRFRDAAVAALPPSQRRMLGHVISVSRHTTLIVCRPNIDIPKPARCQVSWRGCRRRPGTLMQTECAVSHAKLSGCKTPRFDPAAPFCRCVFSETVSQAASASADLKA